VLKTSQKSSSRVQAQPGAASTYRFADFTADLSARTLFKNGQRLLLTTKAFDILAVLLEHAGNVVDKQTLMDLVWPDAHVEEGNVSQNIFVLRKLLGEGARDNQFIVTVPGRGYRFVAHVTQASGPLVLAGERADQAQDVPPVRSRRKVSMWQIAAALLAIAAGLSGYLVFARGRVMSAGVESAARREVLGSPPSGARHSADRAAYQAYLKGRYFWNRRTKADLERSIEYFDEAIRRDPTYALAHAGLADSYVMLARHRDAQSAAQRALAIEPTLGAPHATLGNIALFHDWNWDEAGRELRAAIAADPAYPTAHHWYAYQRAATGHVDDAIREMERATDLDPLSLIIATDLGHMFYLARQYDRAMDQYRRVIEMDRGFVMAHWRLGETLLKVARWDEANDAFRRSGVDQMMKIGEALSAPPRAAEYLRRLSAGIGNPPWNVAYVLAQAMAVAGAIDDALVTLEQSRLQHDPELMLVAVDPAFDGLRQKPEFRALVRQIGLTPD
jgi:DNA-binding winged helix-turn-helix (wHTH) protein/Tfp pilus assembly protein PilF